jgi:Nuclease A inhibitor-like protein
MAKSSVVQALAKASQGLQFQSETDAPFEAFEWEGQEGKPDKARVLEAAGLPASTAVKVKTLAAFFKGATTEQSWHDDQEKAEVEKFKQLVKALTETLTDIKVFQAGKGEADVFIVGRGGSGWAGLKTKVVET